MLLDHALLPGAALHLDLAGAAFVWRPELDGSLAKLHEALWERLRPLPDSVQQETLAAWIGMARPREEACRPLEPEEVLALAAGGLIEIGAHTRTHPLLPAHAPEFQEEEIASSKAEAEALAGRPVTSFAYPYGGYTPETVRLVAASGFARACASIHALVWPDSDRFLLPRIVVGDWDGALFQQRLQEEFLW